MEYSFQRFDADVVKKVSNYEQTVSTLRSENDDLRKKINDVYNESNKKLL